MKRFGYSTILLCHLTLSLLIIKSEVIAASRKDKIIVAGRAVLQNEGSFQAAIIYKQNLTCSGSLLKSHVVLTSASCVRNFDLSKVKVRSGSNAFKKGGQLRSVQQIVMHPLYQSGEHSHNIALLKLNRTFNLTSPNIDMVQLPTPKQSELPSSLFIYGWGISSLNVNGSLSKYLRVSKYKVYSNTKCLRYLPENDKHNNQPPFCVGDRSKHFDICNDDSGGPAVDQNKTQYGVVSHGGKCFPEDIIILTNIIPHLPWIRDVLQSWNEQHNFVYK
ncbi:uncharacterized protein LOC133326597 [Musca vetustissima]|uniref:uncharacterized protein LOC133326597 n=1 Tax=Musca vetustissima TaxID=27455 RepID=UPI002AB7E75E|nr:uncharacterized protein LOC133326597 [Musca vetustissima]